MKGHTMNVADERKRAVTKHSPGAKKSPTIKAKAASSRPQKAAAPLKSSRTGRNPRASLVISAGDKFVLKSFSTGHTPKKPYVSAVSLLGLEGDESTFHLTSMEWISAIRKGIPSSALDSLTAFLLVSQTEFSDALDIPVRTLVRRKGEGRLNSEESAKAVRVARVIQRAEEVFEDPDAARDWLKTANAALNWETPISLLDTEIGAEAVLDTLGRIEHGVFA